MNKENFINAIKKSNKFDFEQIEFLLQKITNKEQIINADIIKGMKLIIDLL